jgi:hypothetical protein
MAERGAAEQIADPAWPDRPLHDRGHRHSDRVQRFQAFDPFDEGVKKGHGVLFSREVRGKGREGGMYHRPLGANRPDRVRREPRRRSGPG